MVSYFVRYRGAADDPDAFYDYYERRHAALLRQLPMIRSLVLHRPCPMTDPFPVRHGETFLLAQMQFDKAGDLDAALGSHARRLAREDFQLFPRFRGEVTHEAMIAKRVF